MPAPAPAADGGQPELSARGGASRWARLWVPVIVAFVAQVPSALFDWPRLRHAPPVVTGSAPEVAIALVGPVALIGARRFPGPVAAVVAAAAAVHLFLPDAESGPPYVALGFAVVSAIVRGARLWAWSSLAFFWFVLILDWALTAPGAFRLGEGWVPTRVAVTIVVTLVVAGLGEAIRAQRERLAQHRRGAEQRRQSEAQAERVRIARELHDVLAHSLSQIHVQASVGLHLLERQPDKAAEALTSIKATSKDALDEVRSVLGVLRADGGADPGAPLVPEPDLSRLESLAESFRAQGIAVTVQVAAEGMRRPVQSAIYRIVQEALTNVLRHARADEATVSIREDAGRYVVEVTDDGVGIQGRGGDGRGLLGMRERAELLGGTLEAGPAAGGGFRVVAVIPAGRSEEAP